MQHLLQMAGYSTYQAQCVAPFLWAVAASGILYIVFPFVKENPFRRKKKPHTAHTGQSRCCTEPTLKPPEAAAYICSIAPPPFFFK
jgi:hypothetical protein